LCNSGKVIARDDKSLVHCDVEVVQRPSKSWKKVVYSDHDWEKDTKRSLQITTYQFVRVKDHANTDNVLQLNGIPVCQSRLTGGGISIVKLHYFEGSTVFRHFNELLHVMSLDDYKNFFKTGSNIIPHLLLTVDGGPDERPRNKQTMFATVLLRKFLNLDKVKVISYAEGCSKRHSVERLHFAEGRSLSQAGPISSKSAHSTEIINGISSEELFRENMEFAREEAIGRLDKTPYAGEELRAIKPPPENDWVITKELISKINMFLKKDCTEYRNEKNFVIHLGKLCEVYDLCPTKCFNAVSIFNEMNDPTTSWLQQYCFVSYRQDDDWIGSSINRFEIQPVVDISALPDHKYLPFQQAKHIVEYFLDNNLEIPQWLRVPDFYLPSKNINYLMKNKPSIFCDARDFTNFQNIVGVNADDIRSYIKKKKCYS
jgi:hypothetical protein